MASAPSSPSSSEPAIGWPPMNRGSATAATALALVEPTSVTTPPVSARARLASSANARTGAATNVISAAGSSPTASMIDRRQRHRRPAPRRESSPGDVPPGVAQGEGDGAPMSPSPITFARLLTSLDGTEPAGARPLTFRGRRVGPRPGDRFDRSAPASSVESGLRARPVRALELVGSARQRPGRVRSASGPMRTRTSRVTGWPIASHIRRTWRLRPSWIAMRSTPGDGWLACAGRGHPVVELDAVAQAAQRLGAHDAVARSRGTPSRCRTGDG